MADDSTPFVCLVCIQTLHKAEIRSLHREIEDLKSVCQELRAELQATKEVAAAAVRPTAATSVINEIHEAAAFQALKKDVENIQAILESQSKSYATAVKIGERNEYRPVKQPNKAATKQSSEGQAKATATDKSHHHSLPKHKVPVAGARKIWGTMKETPATAVTAALTKLTSVTNDQVKVKRKYKSVNRNNNRMRWWFVLRGDEDTLVKLESEWEQVRLQTNWKLEPLQVFAGDSGPVEDSGPTAATIELQVDENSSNTPNSESFLD